MAEGKNKTKEGLFHAVVYRNKFNKAFFLCVQVELWFTEPKGLPGSQTRLVLASAKDSLCGIHAVDKSVYLLKPEAELSPRTVSLKLPLKLSSGRTFLDLFSLLLHYHPYCLFGASLTTIITIIIIISIHYSSFFLRSQGGLQQLKHIFDIKTIYSGTSVF